MYPFAFDDTVYLSIELEVDGFLNVSERVQVFNLYLGSKLFLAIRTDRDIYIAAQ